MEAKVVVKVFLAVKTTDEKEGSNLPRSMETNHVQFIQTQTIKWRIVSRILKALTSREVMNNNNNNEKEEDALLMVADLVVAVDTAAVKETFTNKLTTFIRVNFLINNNNNNNNILPMFPMLTICQRLATVVTVQEVLHYHYHYLK